MAYVIETTLRLVLAAILGGIIGYERENTNRPAGFRTHILVCVGAALVMVTSEYIFYRYSSLSNMDPARLGAQVISGIGFLGAGTIIRDGFNVRGLTTAASLWAVSCVGIAVGIGYYSGAIISTVIIFITLIALKKLEKYFRKKNRYVTIIVEAENGTGRVSMISDIMEKYEMDVKDIQLFRDNSNNILIKTVVKLSANRDHMPVMYDLQSLEGIRKVYEE